MRANRGSITAEWVLILPAVMITLWFILAGISLGLDQSRIQQAAADATRLASLGAADGEIRAHVVSLLGEGHQVDIRVEPAEHRVCVSVWQTASPAWRVALPLVARSEQCGLHVTSP